MGLARRPSRCTMPLAARAAATSSDTVKAMLSVGHLVDIDWRFGLALQSSVCAYLKEPFVTLVLHVSNNAKVNCHTVELSVSQFQDFAAQFKEMERLSGLLLE